MQPTYVQGPFIDGLERRDVSVAVDTASARASFLPLNTVAPSRHSGSRARRRVRAPRPECLPCAVGGIRPARRRACACRSARLARTRRPVRASAASRRRANHHDPRRRRGGAAASSVGRWHHPPGLRAEGLLGPARGARAAPAGESPALSRRAGASGDLATGGRADSGVSGDRRVDGGSAARRASHFRRRSRLALGRSDAARVHRHVLACARCGGRLRLIATVEASDVTRRILRHLGLPTEAPPPTPARAPPGIDDWAL